MTEDTGRTVVQVLKSVSGKVAGEQAAEIKAQTGCYIYPRCYFEYNRSIFRMVRIDDEDLLVITGTSGQQLQFAGAVYREEKMEFRICGKTKQNIQLLCDLFPFARPVPAGKNGITFGAGDRLGFSTAGHIRSFTNYEVFPIFAQQSLRELDLTGRTYRDVIDDASWDVFKTGFTRPWGADGDHLKRPEDVRTALKAGCTMITADLSDYIHNDYAGKAAEDLEKAYIKIDPEYRRITERKYLGKHRIQGDTVLSIGKDTLAELVLIYKDALDHAAGLYYSGLQCKDIFDFEISIDETDIPTSPEAHYFAAKELLDSGVRFTSMAPRFVGEFQKGIDYIGNIDAFEKSFQVHRDIAETFGYRISVHSSSDKFSVYPIIGAAATNRYHVKTSGTSWLIALKVISEVDPDFYRILHQSAYAVFPQARTYYWITPDLDASLDISLLEDKKLYRIFENPSDRQVLHVSYGELLKIETVKTGIFRILHQNIDRYWGALAEHIGKHLSLLGIPPALNRND